MFTYYIKYVLRNFKSNKVIFVGSLLTICLGTLCISLLCSYIFNEYTMNNLHKREKNIYANILKSSPESPWETNNTRLFFNIDYNDYPEIEAAASLMKYEKGEIVMTHETGTFYPEGLVVDTTFFQLFDFELLVGNKTDILNQPDALLITEKFALSLFGDQNPIGKKITVNTYMSDDYTVKGILKNPTANSSIAFDFILPNSYVPNQFAKNGADFLLVNDTFQKDAFVSKLQALTENHPSFHGSIMDIEPLEAAYFNERKVDFFNIFSRFGNQRALYTLIIIILVILIISILNVSNLQIINTNISSKFLAISAVNGAETKQLVLQKVTELFLLACIATIIISVGYNLILPYFNTFTGIYLTPPVWKIVLVNISIVVFITALALIYPLLITIKLPILKGLKNQGLFVNKITSKKRVIVAQFTLTFILLISSVIVTRQLNFMLNKDLGFTSADVIQTQIFRDVATPVSLFSPLAPNSSEADKDKRQKLMADSNDKRKKLSQNYQFFKNELAAHSSISSFSQGPSPLEAYTVPWKVKGGDEEYFDHNTINVSPDHIKIHGFQIVEGRFFEQGKDPSHSNKIVINEAAKKYWGIDNINEASILNKHWSENNEGYEIIGVVKDFNYEHLSSSPKPLIMIHFKYTDTDFLIRFQEGSVTAGLQFVERLVKKMTPNAAFNYSFLEDEVNLLYAREKQLSFLYIIFTILALLISAIGLFTIALYDTHRRIKEIGIRKVNGQKTPEVLAMLIKDFSKHVLIAFIISSPITYLLMRKWLENFAYKTDISWWIFVIAGILVLLISLITVAWQSYVAANRNPIESLRAE